MSGDGDRGRWRWVAGALALAVALGLVALGRVERAPVAPAPGEARLGAGWAPPAGRDPASVAALLEQDLGVTVLYARQPVREPQFSASPISAKDGDRALYFLLPELRRHSRAFLAAARLRHVLLAASLSATGAPSGVVGLTVAGQTFFAADARATEPVLQHVFHHELFHLVDAQLASDPEWDATNPAGFAYDRRDAVKVDPSGSMIDRTRFGFISRYATFSASEDKAELFAFLVTDARQVRELAARDSVLRRKIALLEARVAALAGAPPWPR